MINVYVPTMKPKPLVMLGVSPDDIKSLTVGDSLVAKLRDMSQELPDWTVTITYGTKQIAEHVAEFIHVSIGESALEAILHSKHIEINLPGLVLAIFYTEDEDRFAADLVSRGHIIGSYRDDRGRSVN